MLSQHDEQVAAQARQEQQDLLAALQVQLLGEPCLRSGTNPPQRLAFKDAALLAVLALDGPQPRDKLVALLWPHVSLITANGNLRQRIFRLRHAAGMEIIQSAQLVRIAAGVSVDLLRSHIEPDHLAGLSRQELLAGQDAIDSEPLAEWLQSARERWRITRRDTLMRHVAHLEEHGMLARAIVMIEHLILYEPLLEHGWRCLMRLHYLRGDRAAALATYDRLERILQDELATQPDIETRQLLHTIEQADGHLSSRPAVFPVTLLRPPRLIGRHRQMADMHQTIARRENFWLEGAAGIGKTRLMESMQDDSTILVQAYPNDQVKKLSTLTRLLSSIARFTKTPNYSTVSTAEPVEALEHVQDVLRAVSVCGLKAVLIDDFHHADPASRDVIGRLALDSSSLVSWGLTTRLASSDTELITLKEFLIATGRLTPICLDALTRSESLEFLTALDLPEINRPDLKEHLVNYTNGNPSSMMEMLQRYCQRASEPASQRASEPASQRANRSYFELAMMNAFIANSTHLIVTNIGR